ncbi:MAG: outer membrane beta-barrel protein [Burkholderiaceae bacterium]|nr:outer membrane beta-barrel protein [Burkholderiaceae bacterium]
MQTPEFSPPPAARGPMPAAGAALIAMALAGAPAAASADNGLSVTLFGGASQIADPSTRLGGQGGRLSLGSGLAVGGSVGWRFAPAWRLEGEVLYRNNGVDAASVPGLDPQPGDADYASVALMANLLWDVGRWRVGPATLRPYLGLGIGRLQELDTDLRVSGQAVEFSGSAGARQGLVGLEWDYDSAWTAGVGLRWVDAGRVKLTGAAGALEVDHRGWSAELRLGYRF